MCFMGHQLAIEDIDHSKTQTRFPQSNYICERFRRTMQNYRFVGP